MNTGELLDLLNRKIHHTCGCISTQEAYDAINKLKERIEELEEIEFRYNDLNK